LPVLVNFYKFFKMGDIELNTADRLEYTFFPNDTGYLRFKVRASNDAHIALTTSAAECDPMYEIFIGGWSNQQSIIRKNRTKPDRAEVPTPNILNGGEFRTFWIRWDNKTISCGCENNPQPFMTWTDIEHVPIRYVGVCTGWGASGSWIIHQGAPLPGYGAQPGAFGAPGGFGGPQPGQFGGAQPGQFGGAQPGQFGGTQPGQFGGPQPGQFGGTQPGQFGGTQPGQFGGSQPGQFGGAQPGQFGGTQPGQFGGSQPGQFGQQPGQFGQQPQPGQFGGAQPGQFGGSNICAQCWVPSSGGNVPPRAFVGGNDSNGEPLYVVRCNFQGLLIPGKLVPSHRSAYVPWGGSEHAVAQYEVLCDFGGRWMACTGANIPPNALAGGQGDSGEPLYIGRVSHMGSLTVGKVQRDHGCCYIPYGGQELSFQQYEVLVS